MSTMPHISEDRVEQIRNKTVKGTVTPEEAAAAYQRGGLTVSDCAEAAGIGRGEMEKLLKSLDVTPPHGQPPEERVEHDPYQQPGSRQSKP